MEILEALEQVVSSIKVWTNNKLKAKANITDIVNSDWNASEGEPGHVLNRTHWIDGKGEILPECQPTYDENEQAFYLPTALDLVVGETYIINWNGREYECVCQDGSAVQAGMVGLGNANALMPDMGFISNDEPFAIASMNGMATIVPFDGTTSLTISIYNGVIYKLDNKFIDAEWMATSKEVLLAAEKTVTNLVGTPTETTGGFPDLTSDMVQVGDSLIVVWDGVRYPCTVGEINDDEQGANKMKVAGNALFILMFGQSRTTVGIYDEKSHVASVYGIEHNKLPKKFLPDDIGAVQTVNGVAPDENGNVQIEVGSSGDVSDGFSPIANVTQTDSGAVISITDKSGTTTATITNGKDGQDGKDGKDGYTPVKGKDYFDGVNGKDGQDGYTPVKGVDYFDGIDGKDGKDGSNGKDGVSTTHSWNGTTLTVTSASGSSSADLKGDTGATGQRGTGLLPVTTAPSSYTTAVGGITPKYRMAISTIKTQASVTEVLLGDTVRYSYYHYPIAYLDASYAYFTTRVSIRGATGAAGADGKPGVDGVDGVDGADGKSAYQYAQDAGYTGTEQEFGNKLAEELPNALPNPHPLTINGKPYDGSEAVDIIITGGTASDSMSLGQTPITLPQSANIRLVGDGEHSYTIKGKTIADYSTADVAKTKATFTEHDDYLEACVNGSVSNWYDSHVDFTFSGLTVGEEYMLCVESLGIDNVNLSYLGYFLIRNASGSELARIEDSPAGLTTAKFTANTERIVVLWYPTNGYYWNNGYRTALVGDIYINKASDGTDRTGVFNETGTFTDSYSLGQLDKGVTITTEPSCEVYSVSGGGGSGEASAPLAGKTIVCFGDSLFGMYTGDTSAPAFIAQKTGATVHNVGFSGCRMSEHPYTGFNEFSMYALANAIASGDWSLQDAAASSGSANFPEHLALLKSIDFKSVDAIVIHYGTNDFAAGEGRAIDNAGNPKATNTLCGALRYSVETLLAAFPKLKIFVSLPAFRYWTANDGTITYSDEKKNANGYTLPEFVKALAETAKEYKLPVIDCYYGLGINKSNATAFLADGTHHNIDGRKRFGEYIGAKLIADGDTFHGTESFEGGGSGIDVTAAVGQTIVVKEVDAKGKPTKWEAVDHQPRTHWKEIGELLPNTPAILTEDGVFIAECNFDFVIGKTYTINWNGTPYTCVASDIEGAAAVGNIDALAGTGDSGEPFVAFTDDGALAAFPFDGSAELVIGVTGEMCRTIDKAYLPEDILYGVKGYTSGAFDLEKWAWYEALVVGLTNMTTGFEDVPFTKEQFEMLGEVFASQIIYLESVDRFVRASRAGDSWQMQWTEISITIGLMNVKHKSMVLQWSDEHECVQRSCTIGVSGNIPFA